MVLAIRKYNLKSGKIQTKVYDTVAGKDYGEYKREQSRRYYRKKNPTPGGEIYGKAHRISDETLAAMRASQQAGMSIRAIARAFRLSRFTATKALDAINGC